MAITKQKKEEIVSKMSDIVSNAKTLVFAKFTGLTVAEQNEMRRALRAQDVGYTVAKKSLMRRAFDKANFAGTAPTLVGETAVAYGADELAPARELAVFVKKFPEHLVFAGGVFGGSYVDAAMIKSIAAIPGMQTLRAQFVHIINSPLQKLAVVIDQVASKKEQA